MPFATLALVHPLVIGAAAGSRVRAVNPTGIRQRRPLVAREPAAYADGVNCDVYLQWQIKIISYVRVYEYMKCRTSPCISRG